MGLPFTKKKIPKNGTDGLDGHVTKEEILQMMGEAMKGAADIAVRATDQRMSEIMARTGGVKVPGGMDAAEAKELRVLIYAPKEEHMMEMTIFNEKECALHPWLKTFESSLHAGRRHGSLLGSFLLYKEKCNRSLNGHLLDNTVTMAGMDIQKDTYGSEHVSG